MWTAYKKFWKQYADFKTTASRPDYWWVYLVNIILVSVVTVIMIALGVGLLANAGHGSTDNRSVIGLGIAALILYVLLVAYSLASLVPSIALTFRRYRDTGINLWWFLITPVAAVSAGFFALTVVTDPKGSIFYGIVSGVLLLAHLVILVLPTNYFTNKAR